MKSLDIKPKRQIPPRKIFTHIKVAPFLGGFRWGRIAVAGLLVIALAGSWAYFVLPEASVKVSAQTVTVTKDLEIKVNAAQTQSDSANLIVPGQVLVKEVSGTQSYTSTGKKNVGKKASGFVSLYNFSKTTLILKAATTKLTVNGKKYFFTQDVSGIRPTAVIGQKQEQEIDETSLIAPVPIVAENPGTEYNLPKGARLEIANEVLGSKPEILYALATDVISGGSNKDVKVVTEADIASGYQALTAELAKKTSQELSADAAGQKLLENAIASEVLEKSAKTPPGTEADTFEVSIKVQQKALVFKQSDVLPLITSRIKRLLPMDQELMDNADRLDEQFIQLDLAAGTGTLATHFEGKVVYKIDPLGYADKLRGKTASQIVEILRSEPGVSGVDVKFSPFWVRRAPSFKGKIHIESQ